MQVWITWEYKKIIHTKTSPYPQKNKKQLIHFKNAKEREPKEINTSKLKQVFALIFITSVPKLNSMIYSYKYGNGPHLKKREEFIYQYSSKFESYNQYGHH